MLAESVAEICFETAVPTVVVWLPGLVTLTVSVPLLPPAVNAVRPFGVPRPVGPS